MTDVEGVGDRPVTHTIGAVGRDLRRTQTVVEHRVQLDLGCIDRVVLGGLVNDDILLWVNPLERVRDDFGLASHILKVLTGLVDDAVPISLIGNRCVNNDVVVLAQ